MQGGAPKCADVTCVDAAPFAKAKARQTLEAGRDPLHACNRLEPVGGLPGVLSRRPLAQTLRSDTARCWPCPRLLLRLQAAAYSLSYGALGKRLAAKAPAAAAA